MPDIRSCHQTLTFDSLSIPSYLECMRFIAARSFPDGLPWGLIVLIQGQRFLCEGMLLPCPPMTPGFCQLSKVL